MTKRRPVAYVEAAAGLPALFLCLLIAAVLGCGFRLYFSPARLKSWVTEALDHQKRSMAHPFALSFSGVSLRLSNGAYLPQLAVVVSDVRVAPNPECHPEASVFIGELRLPFRVLSLLAGRAAIGVIGARDVRVDLDGLRARCEKTTAVPVAPLEAPAPLAKKPTVAETAIRLSEPKDDGDVNQAWWTDEQYQTVRGFVEGIQFSRATLTFENKTKDIYLDSFEALFRRGGLVQVESEIQIPPSVAYGEEIPPLKIKGEAVSTKASLVVSARVSEGSLSTTAIFTPGPAQTVAIDARVSVKSLPLSQLTPLLRKATLANDRFNPKFLWLDCAATITGQFQGLFQKSPLKLEACRIEGDGTNIQLSSAERSPRGEWKPFDVSVVSLSLGKLFETIGVRGPEGVASNYGTLSGRIHVQAQDEARFKGQLRNAQIEFSNRKVRASQKIETASVELSIVANRVKATFDHFVLTNGQLTGAAHFDLDRSLKSGTGEVEISKLKFDPAVQAVLVGGDLGEIAGAAHAKLEDTRITDIEARLKIGETKALNYEFEQASLNLTRVGEAPPKVTIDSPSIELKTSALEPILFGHELGAFEHPHVELTILEDGDIDWSKGHATLQEGRINLETNGAMNRDHIVNGSLRASYPKIKGLLWTMKGEFLHPMLTGTGDAYKALKERAEIDDKVLGL